MLEKNRFQPHLDFHPVNESIYKIVEILNEQALMQRVKLKLARLPGEVILDLDLLRMQ